MDRLIEQAGFTSVDELDAEAYRLIREAQVCALEKLLHRLKTEKDIPAAPLAIIAQKLGQMEKDKLAAIQLKIGRPADLVKTGRVIRARIGIAAKGPDGTGAAMAVELESSDDKTSLAEDA